MSYPQRAIFCGQKGKDMPGLHSSLNATHPAFMDPFPPTVLGCLLCNPRYFAGMFGGFLWRWTCNALNLSCLAVRLCNFAKLGGELYGRTPLCLSMTGLVITGKHLHQLLRYKSWPLRLKALLFQCLTMQQTWLLSKRTIQESLFTLLAGMQMLLACCLPRPCKSAHW